MKLEWIKPQPLGVLNLADKPVCEQARALSLASQLHLSVLWKWADGVPLEREPILRSISFTCQAPNADLVREIDK